MDDYVALVTVLVNGIRFRRGQYVQNTCMIHTKVYTSFDVTSSL
jgi:hypothetical protein